MNLNVVQKYYPKFGIIEVYSNITSLIGIVSDSSSRFYESRKASRVLIK